MKKLLFWVLLISSAVAQQVNQDIIPATTGLNLGHTNQRWNAYINNLNITGSCTLNGQPCFGGGGGGGGNTHPALPFTSVQFNNSGTFGGSASFTFNPLTSSLSLIGTLSVSGNAVITGTLTNTILGVGGPFCLQETNGIISSTGVACGGGGGGGSVSGSGTANRISMWTAPTVLGNSSITDNGTTLVSTGETLTLTGTAVNNVAGQALIVNQNTTNIGTGCSNFNIDITHPNPLQCVSSQFGFTPGSTSNITSAFAVWGTLGPPGKNVTNVEVAGAFTIGSTSNTIAEARAIHAAVNASAGTVNTATGVFAETFNNNIGASNFTTARALYAINVYGGVGGTGATNSYGLYVDSPNINGVSTISHQYGVFIADQSPNGLGLNSDPWGIFEAGTAKNQLGGSLTLAGISGSVQCLHVNAAGLITGTGVDCGSGGTLPSGTGVLTIVAGAYGSVLSTNGSGNVVLTNSPALVTPNLGTPSTLVLTNATGAPTWNQNTSGTAANLLGCTPSTAGDVCIWTGSAWLKFAGNTSGTASLQENASGVPSWGSGSATTFQVDGVALTSATTVNFQDSAATDGLTLTFTNPSAGNVQLGFTGKLTNAGINTPSTTVNSQTCTLGSTCTIPFQTNTVNNTSQAGINHLTSTTNAVGLTVTPVNSATNAVKMEITGGSYTGNAAGLFGTPSITVNAVTATQINGTTWTGTWAGSPTISGNPIFSGSPAFNMTGGPFCVQETAGVLSSTGSACGSGGGGSISGTANYVAAFNAGGTGLVSVGSLISGQLVVIQNGAAPIASSPSLFDSGSAGTTGVNTTPYTIQCDSATTLLDRSTTLPFTSGANIVTVPLSSASGCAGLAVIVEAQTSITLGPTGADTFTVYGAGGAALTGQTTLAMSSGQTASLNQSSTGIWTIRFAEGGTVYNVTSGAGLTGGPCTGSCTLSIPASGVTNAMLNGSIGLAKLAGQATNTIVANVTSGSAVPTAVAVASCSGNNQASQWTTNTGPTCNSSIGMLNVASTWTTNQTLTGHLIVSGHDVAIPLTCANTTASGTAQVCNTTPTFTPVANDCVNFTTNTANTGTGLTINVNSLGAKSIAKWQTSTTLAANDVRANTATTLCYDGTNWEIDTIGNGPTGTGTVTVVSSGSLGSTQLVSGGGSQTLQTACSGCTLTSTDMVLSTTLSDSGPATFSYAGTSSTPGLTISGAPDTADGTTHNFPQLYINTTGAAAVTSFSGNGTMFGMNAPAAFTGNLLSAGVNGSISILIGSGGAITLSGSGVGIGSTATGSPRINFNTSSISANQPLSIVQATNQLVTGTSTNLTTTTFPASSGAVTVTMPNVTTTVAALDVANTWNALQTFGSNISIGGTTATGATGTGSVVFATSPTVTGLSSDAITCGVASTTACVITGNGSTSGTATLTWPAVSGTATNPITSSNRISAPEFTSTVATGTAPLVVASTTKVTNLNSDTTDGIGLGTPVAGGIGYGVTTTQIGTTAAGTAGQVVYSGGTSAPTISDIWLAQYIPAANCNNITAGAGWSIPSGGTVSCRAGTNNLGGYITISDTSSTFAQFATVIPFDWDTGARPYIRVFFASASDTTNGHTVIPQVKVSCAQAANGTTSDDATLTAAQSLSTTTFGASAVANGFYSGSNVQFGATQMTGCVAGGLFIVQIGRATDTATGNVNFYGATITWPHGTPGTAQAN